MKKAKKSVRGKAVAAPVELDLPAAILDAVKRGEAISFEERVRAALDDLPAQFLFHMRIDLAPVLDVAAVVTTDNEAADFLIVRQSEGQEVAIEPASQSDLPIAALIPAYAGLAATLPVAA
jgi:hypothetical protein